MTSLSRRFRVFIVCLKVYLCPVHPSLHSCLALLSALVLALPQPAWGALSLLQLDLQAQPNHGPASLAATAKDCRAEVRSPTWCASELKAQLIETLKHPRELIRLRSLRRTVRLAKIELLRAHHRLGATKQRQELARELISTQPLTSEELLHLGPELAREVEREQSALDQSPLGLIRVECDDSCAVLVNEVLMNRASRLPYGNYRVVVCAANQGIEPLEQRIFINEQSSSASLALRLSRPEKKDPHLEAKTKAYEITPPSRAIPVDEQASNSTRRPHHPSTPALKNGPASDTMLLTQPLVRPVLPRPMLRTGLGIGLLATMTGSTFIALDEFCFQKDRRRCNGENRFQTKELGIGTMVAGGVFLVTTVVALIVERVRGRRAREAWIRQRR